MDKAIIIEEWSLLTICFWCFDLWGLADPGETAPHRISHFLEIVKDLPGRVPSYVITDPEPTPQWPVFFELSQGSHTQSHCLPALIPPGPCTGHPGAGPVLQTPLKLFTLANPVLPVPSCRNNSKGSCAHFLWCSLPRGWPRTSPCGPSWRGMPLLWGTVNNKLFSVSGFSWLAGFTIYES